MSITYNAKIKLKRGFGNPSTNLDVGEAGFDLSTNRLYLGKGVGLYAIPVAMLSDLSSNTYEFIKNSSLSDDFIWNGGLLEVSLGGIPGVATIAYVDGSLFLRDLSINNLRDWNISQDASISLRAMEASLGLYATNVSVGLAIQDFATNSSVGLAIQDFATNSSVGLAIQDFATNSSVGLAIQDFATNSSVNTALNPFATNVSVGLAIQDFATNSSVGLAIQDFATNSSVNTALNPFATNSSVGLALELYATNASVGLAISPFATNSSVGLALSNKLNNTTDTFTGILTVNGSISIFGDIYQDGSSYITHAENLYTTKDFIIMRDGTAVPLFDGSISGLKIMIPNGTNNVIFGTNKDAIMRVGWEGDTLVALAGREDNPTNQWYAYWDDSSTMFKTFDLKGYIDGSLVDFATNSSVNNALLPFATNSSVGLAIQDFATNSSVNIALNPYATNASVGLAGFLKGVALNPYATNASVGLAIQDFATNSSVNNALLPFATNASVGLALSNKLDKLVTINPQTGITYQLALTDISKTITLANSAPISVTIPTEVLVPFSVGTKIDLIQNGTGSVTVGGAGITIKSKNDNKTIAAQNVDVTLLKESTNTWYLLGDLITPSFQFSITSVGSNDTFTLPLINGGTFNFVASWGDGTPDSTITAYNVNNTHVYATAGNYIITLKGICTQFAFNNAGSCTRVKQLLAFAGDMGFTVLNFYGCTNLTDITSTMSNLKSLTTANNMFNTCTALTSIPAGIFDGCAGILIFNSTFIGCSTLTTIPSNLFKSSTLATDFQGTFRACTHLTSLPIDLFRYNTLVTSFSNLCLGCTLLASIPVDLFRYNTLVTSFGSAFRGCTVLASIPVDLFRYNLAVTTFTYAFYQCTSLTSLPVDLFRYNLAVTTFDNVFRGCTALASIPVDLFRYNTLATNFNMTLNGCINAQLNINIFYATGGSGTRFLNQSVNFGNCFYRDSFTGVQGTAPDLWNCNFGTGTPTKAGCFGGAGNSLTSLTNYASITADWK
jgi:hypothetical protein